MTLHEFLTKYLKSSAIITLSNTHGSIMYEGKVKDLPAQTLNVGYNIVSLEGVGSQKDIIIIVHQEED